jgi:hypothetical protein
MKTEIPLLPVEKTVSAMLNGLEYAMNRNRREFFLTVFIAATGMLLSAAFAPAFAQANIPGVGSGLPQDWSHRHMLYTNPDTQYEAARKDTLAYEQWKQKNRDPRFAAQVARKTRFVQTTEHSPFSPQQLQWADRFRRDPPPAAGPAIHRDWSNVLGGVTGVGHAGVFPAKYQFDINATPSCANDFVVYTTASAGATSSGAFATQTGTFTANPTAGQTVTISRTGSPALVLTASTTSNLGLNFQIGATTAATAANLADAITRNGGTAGVTATRSAGVVTVTSLTAGAAPGVTLAEGLSNFTWAATSLAGGTAGSGQPTIIAFSQLYSSCGTTPTTAVPKTFWSYNTGAGAFTETSPVLSLDGTQVAFVQRTGTVASLVLLKWSSTVSVGTVGAPTAPTSVTPAAYPGCTAPCMTVMTLNGSPNNTNSSPYYVYFDDILYVGADNGTLHKFTGVFSGTPVEQVTGGFPATVSTGNILSSPVYDFGTGLVFVGSDTGASTGGQLHSVCAVPSINPTVCTASGAVVSSAALAAYTIVATGLNTTGVRDGPIVDSSAHRVYAFVESDTNTSCGGVNCKAVYQFRTNVSINNSTGSRVNVGRGQIATRVLYAGTFDNSYYTSADPANPSGNLYICGALVDGSDSKKPTLWKIPITNNTMGTPVAGPVLVSTANFADAADCSPVTEVMNGTNDYIFVSVSAFGNDTGCSGACIYMFNLTGKTWNAAATANAGLAAPGGTGGIVVDNISSTTGASQIYYSTLTSPGNAVQASQGALN